jgi:FAD/FMN-containing dehydrogenase
LDGGYSEVADAETSFSGGRSPRYAIFIVALAATRELLTADRRWVRSFWEALRPYALGIGSYVNGMAEFEEDRVRAAYGAAKYQRLATIKADYDPENVFHHNANIKPALAPQSTTG